MVFPVVIDTSASSQNGFSCVLTFVLMEVNLGVPKFGTRFHLDCINTHITKTKSILELLGDEPLENLDTWIEYFLYKHGLNKVVDWHLLALPVRCPCHGLHRNDWKNITARRGIRCCHRPVTVLVYRHRPVTISVYRMNI
jgi:hypothetical protein